MAAQCVERVILDVIWKGCGIHIVAFREGEVRLMHFRDRCLAKGHFYLVISREREEPGVRPKGTDWHVNGVQNRGGTANDITVLVTDNLLRFDEGHVVIPAQIAVLNRTTQRLPQTCKSTIYGLKKSNRNYICCHLKCSSIFLFILG